MATGTYFEGQCFATPYAAMAAYVREHHPTIYVQEGSCAYKVMTFPVNGESGAEIQFYKSLHDGLETPSCPTVVWTEYTPFPDCADLALTPWNLSTSDGALVAGAVAAVWFTGWALRAARLALGNPDTE